MVFKVKGQGNYKNSCLWIVLLYLVFILARGRHQLCTKLSELWWWMPTCRQCDAEIHCCDNCMCQSAASRWWPCLHVLVIGMLSQIGILRDDDNSQMDSFPSYAYGPSPSPSTYMYTSPSAGPDFSGLFSIAKNVYQRQVLMLLQLCVYFVNWPGVLCSRTVLILKNEWMSRGQICWPWPRILPALALVHRRSLNAACLVEWWSCDSNCMLSQLILLATLYIKILVNYLLIIFYNN